MKYRESIEGHAQILRRQYRREDGPYSFFLLQLKLRNSYIDANIYSKHSQSYWYCSSTVESVSVLYNALNSTKEAYERAVNGLLQLSWLPISEVEPIGIITDSLGHYYEDKGNINTFNDYAYLVEVVISAISRGARVLHSEIPEDYKDISLLLHDPNTYSSFITYIESL